MFARLCDLPPNVFDFFRVTALAIRFHEMIASSTAYFRLLELEYSSVTGFYLAFPHLLGRSADINTLDGGVAFLLTEMPILGPFTEVQFSHAYSIRV